MHPFSLPGGPSPGTRAARPVPGEAGSEPMSLGTEPPSPRQPERTGRICTPVRGECGPGLRAAATAAWRPVDLGRRELEDCGFSKNSYHIDSAGALLREGETLPHADAERRSRCPPPTTNRRPDPARPPRVRSIRTNSATRLSTAPRIPLGSTSPRRTSGHPDRAPPSWSPRSCWRPWPVPSC